MNEQIIKEIGYIYNIIDNDSDNVLMSFLSEEEAIRYSNKVRKATLLFWKYYRYINKIEDPEKFNEGLKNTGLKDLGIEDPDIFIYYDKCPIVKFEEKYTDISPIIEKKIFHKQPDRPIKKSKRKRNGALI